MQTMHRRIPVIAVAQVIRRLTLDAPEPRFSLCRSAPHVSLTAAHYEYKDGNFRISRRWNFAEMNVLRYVPYGGMRFMALSDRDLARFALGEFFRLYYNWLLSCFFFIEMWVVIMLICFWWFFLNENLCFFLLFVSNWVRYVFVFIIF